MERFQDTLKARPAYLETSIASVFYIEGVKVFRVTTDVAPDEDTLCMHHYSLKLTGEQCLWITKNVFLT
jgi:hypothetical protein